MRQKEHIMFKSSNLKYTKTIRIHWYIYVHQSFTTENSFIIFINPELFHAKKFLKRHLHFLLFSQTPFPMWEKAAPLLPGDERPEHDSRRHSPQTQDPPQPKPAGRKPRRVDHGLEGSPEGRHRLGSWKPWKQVWFCLIHVLVRIH